MIPPFNPLPSHEGRQRIPSSFAVGLPFNPLPSHEGRRLKDGELCEVAESFNPLPSHEGRPSLLWNPLLPVSFNPLPSHEGRPILPAAGKDCMTFQSTSLSRGKTLREDKTAFRLRSFNPLPSHEGRLDILRKKKILMPFNPLPSHEGRL